MAFVLMTVQQSRHHDPSFINEAPATVKFLAQDRAVSKYKSSNSSPSLPDPQTCILSPYFRAGWLSAEKEASSGLVPVPPDWLNSLWLRVTMELSTQPARSKAPGS